MMSPSGTLLIVLCGIFPLIKGVDSKSLGQSDGYVLVSIFAVVLMVTFTGLCLKRGKNTTKEDDSVSRRENTQYYYVSNNLTSTQEEKNQYDNVFVNRNISRSLYTSKPDDGEYLDMSCYNEDWKGTSKGEYVTMDLSKRVPETSED